MARKTPKNKKTRKIPYDYYLLAVLAVLIIGVLFFLNRNGQEPFAARVNNEDITIKELDTRYDALPKEYKDTIPKEAFLQHLINERLLIQEALKYGIVVDEEEVDAVIQRVISLTGKTMDEFTAALQEKGVTLEELRESYKEQLMANRFLNETLFRDIYVNDQEAEYFYKQNKEQLPENASFEDIKDELRNFLLNEKRQRALSTYLMQLGSKAEIQFFEGPEARFVDTGEDVCFEDGMPIIRLYTVSKCKSCSWLKPIFASIANANGVRAYHWELDTGDNQLTSGKENGIPADEVALFKKYNPQSTVPTLLFGCKYLKKGTSFEKKDDPKAELQYMQQYLNFLR